jgi:hypothetical protein
MQVDMSESPLNMYAPPKNDAPPVKPTTRFEKLHDRLLKIISLRLWLIDFLLQDNVKEEQFNRMLMKYEDDYKHHLKDYYNLVRDARDTTPLENSMNDSKIYLEELRMKKEIGIISEGEYRAKMPKYRWEIEHYRREILRRQGDLEALEDPTSVMPLERLNEVRRQMDSCLNGIDELNTAYRISQETKDRVMDTLLEMHRYFNSFSVWGQRQSEWTKPDLRPPVKEEISENREDASVEEPGDFIKPEERDPAPPEETDQYEGDSEPEIEKEPQLTRVECPYEKKGKKCRVKAFGGSELEAYRKLEAHVEKHHPERVDEFRLTKLGKS